MADFKHRSREAHAHEPAKGSKRRDASTHTRALLQRRRSSQRGHALPAWLRGETTLGARGRVEEVGGPIAGESAQGVEMPQRGALQMLGTWGQDGVTDALQSSVSGLMAPHEMSAPPLSARRGAMPGQRDSVPGQVGNEAPLPGSVGQFAAPGVASAPSLAEGAASNIASAVGAPPDVQNAISTSSSPTSPTSQSAPTQQAMTSLSQAVNELSGALRDGTTSRRRGESSTK